MKPSVADGLVTALSLAGVSEVGADLPLMSYGYQDGDLTTVTKPSGADTIFVYTAAAASSPGSTPTAAATTTSTTTATVTDPLGHTTRFTYDPRGNLLTRTDPLDLTTAFSYDEDGRAVSAIRPDGSELRTVRGPFGLPVEVIGPYGARMAHEQGCQWR